jgi:uncharacterized protein (TIGR03437 family)
MAVNGALFFVRAVGLTLLFHSCLNPAQAPTIPESLPRFAPGQIATVDFFDIATAFPRPVSASSLPLPTRLAGLTVLFRQYENSEEFEVPLLSIRQEACGPSAPSRCASVTRVDLQIPVTLFIPPVGSLAPVAPAVLVPVENGVRRSELRFLPAADSIHIALTCDAPQQSCRPSVTHEDGQIVTPANPAAAGEALVVYALGLGRTTPDVVSGAGAPVPPAVAAGRLSVALDFGVNAPPRPAPSPKSEPSDTEPLTAWLRPGFAGLYQAKVVVPPVPQALPACGGAVLSNLTITLLGRASAGGAAICVSLAGN